MENQYNKRASEIEHEIISKAEVEMKVKDDQILKYTKEREIMEAQINELEKSNQAKPKVKQQLEAKLAREIKSAEEKVRKKMQEKVEDLELDIHQLKQTHTNSLKAHKQSLINLQQKHKSEIMRIQTEHKNEVTKLEIRFKQDQKQSQ